jgi:hypothetical protein
VSTTVPLCAARAIAAMIRRFCKPSSAVTSGVAAPRTTAEMRQLQRQQVAAVDRRHRCAVQLQRGLPIGIVVSPEGLERLELTRVSGTDTAYLASL